MKTGLAAAAALISLAALAGARADTAQDMGAGAMNRSPPYNFQGGEAVFKNICQGCHMATMRDSAQWAPACIRRWPRTPSWKWRAIPWR